MNILLLNGSPQGKKSNTLKITNAFLQGLLEKRLDAALQRIEIARQSIQPCRGCYGCWTVSPGRCVQRDDMDELLPRFNAADCVVWSFPLYYFGMPSALKCFVDRLMPNNLPFFQHSSNGGARHPQRGVNPGQRHMVISTCGFHTLRDNYEALELQLRMIFGRRMNKIFCPEGGIFAAPHPSRPIREYLEQVRCAGEEYAGALSLSPEAQQKLSLPVFQPEQYMQAVNLVWKHAGTPLPEAPVKPLNAEALGLMEHLCSSFTPDTARDAEVIIQLHFTDLGNTFHLHIHRGQCDLNLGGIPNHTLLLHAPMAVWRQIILEKRSITPYFVEESLQLRGDFDTFLRLDDFFAIHP